MEQLKRKQGEVIFFTKEVIPTRETTTAAYFSIAISLRAFLRDGTVFCSCYIHPTRTYVKTLQHKLNEEWIKMSNKKKALNCNSLAHSTESQVIHSQLPLSEAEAHRQKKIINTFYTQKKRYGICFPAKERRIPLSTTFCYAPPCLHSSSAAL